jgi:hypothetical protein
MNKLTKRDVSFTAFICVCDDFAGRPMLVTTSFKFLNVIRPVLLLGICDMKMGRPVPLSFVIAVPTDGIAAFESRAIKANGIEFYCL